MILFATREEAELLVKECILIPVEEKKFKIELKPYDDGNRRYLDIVISDSLKKFKIADNIQLQKEIPDLNLSDKTTTSHTPLDNE